MTFKTPHMDSDRGARHLGAFTFMMLGAALLLLAGCQTSNPELRHQGSIAYNRGNYEQARTLYGQAVEQRPHDYEAQYGLGRAYLALNQPRDAQHAFERARVLVEDMPERRASVFDQIAEALYQQERHDRLHAFLQDTASQYGTPRDYLRQARYTEKMGDIDSAEVAYRRAAYFAGPEDVEPYLALAKFYESLNDSSRAERALRWAYYVDPGNTEVAEGLRRHQVVPGPTIAERPPKSELAE